MRYVEERKVGSGMTTTGTGEDGKKAEKTEVQEQNPVGTV